MLRRSLIPFVVAAALGLGALLSACGSDSAAPEVKLSPAGERGKTVAREQGCIACHTADGSKSVGPTWKGLAGSQVTLDGGEKVTADAAYLRQSILQSRADVVEGYPNSMPVYDGELTDAEVDDLIAYIDDLSKPEAEAGSDSGN